MTPESGKIVAGKYRLERPLAEGGMGAVWVAQHLDLEVNVAMKFMLGDLADDPTVRQRFAREAKAAAKLKSPHITQIHDYGVYEDAPYMVMELLEGRDLDEVVMNREELGLSRVADIVEQLCRGLSFAHDAGIVHRDLKPSNLFLAEVGDQTIVKVLDFGIAKVMRSDLAVSKGTESGVLVGSPRYMSPEQATGEPLDGRSDLWSVGVVIYELLTGVSPFDAESLGKVITLICTGDIPAPSHFDRRIGSEVDRFFEKVFERDPDRRFQSAMELSDAFALVARGEALPSSVDPLAETNDTATHELGAGTDRGTLELPPETERIVEPSRGSEAGMAAKTTPMMTPAPVSTRTRQASGGDDGTSPPSRLLMVVAGALLVGVTGVGIWATRDDASESPSPAVESTERPEQTPKEALATAEGQVTAEAPEGAPPAASASVSAAASATAVAPVATPRPLPKALPMPVAPPVVPPPAAPPAPKYDPKTGLPITN